LKVTQVKPRERHPKMGHIHRRVTYILFVFFFCFTIADAKDTIRFIVTDLEGLEEIQREFGSFRDLLEKLTGLEIKFYPVTNRTTAVEALRSKKADFVLTGPAEYVVIRKLTKAKPVIGFSRPDYFSSIIVMADSGISSIQDLKGKKIAFGDFGSTSNHLAPMQILADYGIDPIKDILSINTSRPICWESLKRKEVSAIGMNNSKFLLHRTNGRGFEPGAFKVIGRSPDLPNDVLVAAEHVDPSIINTIRKAISENSSALIQEIIKSEDNEKYCGMKFITTIKDRDYNYVRQMYKTIGRPQFSEFIKEQ
jgi:phosphonate transport system substrate-binding protein